ncbi:MAG TPA: hypothetical protein PKL31_10420 [Fulvivirga sp.]|nr:hypothetical protein [Fulvivirga sp.]
MNRSALIISFFNLSILFAQAQDSLPYREVPNYPQAYSAGTVAARVIDGLGFRFYWATEGLRADDLKYKPSEAARTSEETIDHIYGMSKMIVNATKGEINQAEEESLSFEEKRRLTLSNLKEASDILKQSDDLEAMKVIFENEKGRTEYPFWNLLNGPIDDCIWHVGQIVTFRRTSGNPISPKVSFFSGKVRQ